MNEQITIQPEPQANGAVALIREAMASGKSTDYLRELLAVKEAWEASEARKAFNRAISDFQRLAPIIEKGDTAHNKQYARMDRIWRSIKPLLTDLGLSITWQIAELRDNMCHVEGHLRHRDGHGEKLTQDIPLPEIISGQNRAQQMGSAATYARRYALCAALGIVTGDEDDGHKAGAQFVTVEQAGEIGDLIDACRGVAGFNERAFWGWAGATCAQEVQANRYTDVVAALRKKLKGPTQ
jgi:hypothetical protein